MLTGLVHARLRSFSGCCRFQWYVMFTTPPALMPSECRSAGPLPILRSTSVAFTLIMNLQCAQERPIRDISARTRSVVATTSATGIYRATGSWRCMRRYLHTFVTPVVPIEGDLMVIAAILYFCPRQHHDTYDTGDWPRSIGSRHGEPRSSFLPSRPGRHSLP